MGGEGNPVPGREPRSHPNGGTPWLQPCGALPAPRYCQPHLPKGLSVEEEKTPMTSSLPPLPEALGSRGAHDPTSLRQQVALLSSPARSLSTLLSPLREPASTCPQRPRSTFLAPTTVWCQVQVPRGPPTRLRRHLRPLSRAAGLRKVCGHSGHHAFQRAAGQGRSSRYCSGPPA